MREEVVPSLLFGVTLGVVALAFVIWAAGGGHGSYLPAKLLFPYTMLIAGDSVGFLGMLLAIVQWPLYAAAVLFGASARRFHLAWALGAAHGTAALACLSLLRDW
jgi:hypothetical protein